MYNESGKDQAKRMFEVPITPIFRMEVERMKLNLNTMLQSYSEQMQADIEKSITDAVTPEKMLEVIQTAAARAIKECIAEEIGQYFKYGNGRKAVKESVEKMLKSYDTNESTL